MGCGLCGGPHGLPRSGERLWICLRLTGSLHTAGGAANRGRSGSSGSSSAANSCERELCFPWSGSLRRARAHLVGVSGGKS